MWPNEALIVLLVGHTISSKYKNNVTHVGRQTQIGQNRAKYSIEISEMWYSYCELIIT